jgi:hypothetical protein
LLSKEGQKRQGSVICVGELASRAVRPLERGKKKGLAFLRPLKGVERLPKLWFVKEGG